MARSLIYRLLALLLLGHSLIGIVGAAQGWIFATLDWAPYMLFVLANGWLAVCCSAIYLVPRRSTVPCAAAVLTATTWVVAARLSGGAGWVDGEVIRASGLIAAGVATWCVRPMRIHYHRPVRGEVDRVRPASALLPARPIHSPARLVARPFLAPGSATSDRFEGEVTRVLGTVPYASRSLC